jgi:anti-repressor protein
MNLEVYSYQNSNLRVVHWDGEPWFVAKDVCNILEIDTSQTRRLDEDEKGLRLIQTPGGEQEMVCVNEPGLYSLILGSRKPEAKRFKRWVTHEVLPSIRKHGIYATPQTVEAMLQDPDTMIRTLQALKEEREKRLALERKVEEDKPRVLFSKAVEASHTSILIGDLAKLLRQNGVQIGQNRLFAWMRDNGYLIKSGSSRNMPTQYSMERGWFEVKERTISNPDGSIRIIKTPKVTGKGQQYFINLFLGGEEAK